MNFRIKIFILLVLIACPIGAQEINLKNIGLRKTFVKDSAILFEILEVPEDQWFDPDEIISNRDNKDLWLKVALPDVEFENHSFLTEHKGVRFWEYYLVKNNSFVSKSDVDWSIPYWNTTTNAAQYRGLSYASFSQYSGSGYFLLIHIKNEYISNYNFVLRSIENFTKVQQRWSLMQGMGIGYQFMILLLSIILILKMKYLVNWFYFLLVIFSGFSIFYVSGLGPYLFALFRPGESQHFWYVLLSLFAPIVILYIDSFLEVSYQRSPVRFYFRILLILSSLLAVIPIFISTDRVYLFVNIQAIVTFGLITLGLFWLTFLRRKAAYWLLLGWLFNFVTTTMGYALSQMDSNRTMIAIVLHFLSQGVMAVFFGGAMILDIDEKRKKEADLRVTAEATAKNAIELMSKNERMADMGRLVASVSHELETPLGVGVTLSTSLTSSSKSLYKTFIDGKLSEEHFRLFVQDVQQFAELIFRNMETAVTLIRSFKEVASDQVVVDIRTINLNEYLEVFLKVITPGIRKSGAVIEVQMSNDLTITCIPGILTQVLNNLINNALNHGLDGVPEGKIIIKGYMENKYIILAIQDNGKGIPADIQDKVFDLYFTTKKGRGGTGVGLSIVRSLVTEKLKGSVSFISTPGGGTVFILKLPENINESNCDNTTMN